ncbi:hypothetical protein C0Q70_00561 [Pomacea canaliculata]|uniref:Uncharacterized protein n=1 Tax=Pomacea canaliculata TaxID=400727 RepID=A0A2T7PX20_POMCA|nr:hypothetical protein C0Q70_00561 [Pomacea canaliculata]
MRSLSSGLNALGAVTFSDVMQTNRCCKNVSEFRSTIISKLLVVKSILHLDKKVARIQRTNDLRLRGATGRFFGTMTSLVLMMWIGLGAFFNDVKTPLLVTSTTACNWTAKANITEPNVNLTLLTTTATTMTTVTHSSSAGVLEPLYQMSYMWYSGLGMIFVWGPGIVISFLTGSTKPTSIDPPLICPIFDKLFPYLPEKILKPLRFGIVHEGKYDRSATKSTICNVQPGSASSFNKNPEFSKERDGDNTFVKPTREEDDIPTVKIIIGDGNINEAFAPGESFENGVVQTRL